jgi:hypothetical protein
VPSDSRRDRAPTVHVQHLFVELDRRREEVRQLLHEAQVQATKALELRSACGRFFKDTYGHVARDEELSVLSQLSGLQRIESFDENEPTKHSKIREERWSEMAAALRKWVPGVRVSIRALVCVWGPGGDEMTPTREY